MTNAIEDYIKLAEAATDGPWIIADDDGRKNIRINMLTEIVPEYSPNKQLVTVSCTAWRDHYATAKHNAQFIAASRTLGPALAKALLEAEEVIAGLSANVEVLLDVIANPNSGTAFQKQFVLQVAKDTVQDAGKTLATIQKLKEQA